jgi:hypothetical protein
MVEIMNNRRWSLSLGDGCMKNFKISRADSKILSIVVVLIAAKIERCGTERNLVFFGQIYIQYARMIMVIIIIEFGKLRSL